MDLIVRAFPVLRGKKEEMAELAREANRRWNEFSEFYGRFGAKRESWHLQETEHGAVLIGVTQLGARPVEVVAPEYAQSHHAFDRWLKDRIRAVTGVNLDEQPLGPPSRCVFDWHAEGKPATADP